ncbi:MAG: SpoIIE family protein phosphatase, partial [Leptospira sp.]|nr:SpoIIE family protein phosphatase [Leptospira sp.]
PRGKGIAGLVLETLETVIVNDAENDSRIYRNIDETSGFKTRNLICVPMIAQGEIQGVLEAVNANGRDFFDDKDIKLLRYLSDLAAIAIRNRILIDELTSRVNELNCLFQISQALSNIIDIEQFLDLAVKSIAEVLHVNRVSIAFKDPKTKAVKISKSAGFTLDEESLSVMESSSVIHKVIQSGEPILVENIDHSGLKFARPDTYLTKSFLSVPIKSESETIGVLSLSDKKTRAAFDQLDLRVVTTISNQISEAYNSLRSRAQQERLAAIQRDMKTASEIQKYSLPNIPKKIQDLEIETLYEASKDIGGDFYDLIYHNEDEVSVLIADVSGKGIPAALFMEFSKTIVAGEAARLTSPSESLMNANKIIKEKSGYFMFVTLMLIRINRHNKTLKFASAGHNRQFLYRARTKSIEFLSGKGTPLGVGDNPISEHTIEYSPDDLIILYTDGITETENETGEMYEEENFRALIENNGNLPILELKQLIRKTTNDFQGNAEVHDDYTLMIVKLK